MLRGSLNFFLELIKIISPLFIMKLPPIIIKAEEIIHVNTKQVTFIGIPCKVKNGFCNYFHLCLWYKTNCVSLCPIQYSQNLSSSFRSNFSTKTLDIFPLVQCSWAIYFPSWKSYHQTTHTLKYPPYCIFSCSC